MSWLFANLPMLIVLPPLISAPIVMMMGNRNVMFTVCMTATIIAFLASLIAMSIVSGGTVLSYALGGFSPPVGIEYRIDSLNGFIVVLITFCTMITMPYAHSSARVEIKQKHNKIFYACIMLCAAGLNGVIVTGDVFNVFVFLEISALATYILIASGAAQNKKAIKATWDYLVLGTIGATFFVIGIGLLYMVTGTLNMVDMATKLAEIDSNRTVQSAFAFIIVGIGLKAALYPLHRWLPAAYTCSPSAISAILAATSTKVALYVIIRFMFSIYYPKFQIELNILELILMPIGVIAMFLGSLMAIYQVNVKRMLAYSSIAQIGLMVIGISTIAPAGLTGALTMMGSHAITKAALFIAIGACMIQVMKKQNQNIAEVPIEAIRGLGKQMPWTSAGIVIAGLSLIGVPATTGFVAKWILLLSLFDQGKWPIVIAIVIASLLTILYVWKIVEALYLKKPTHDSTINEAPLSMTIPLWTLIIIILYFGIQPYGITNYIGNATVELLGGGFIKDPFPLGNPR